jgi:chaperonin GroES
MNLKPTGNKVIIERFGAKTVSEGGIHLPETAKEQPQSGRIVAAGEIDEDQYGIGDEVIFASYAGTEIEVDETKYIIMSEDEILAVVN